MADVQRAESPAGSAYLRLILVGAAIGIPGCAGCRPVPGARPQGRGVVSPLLFAALLVGSQGADTISASVMAVAAAWLTMRVLDQRLRPVQ